MRSPRNRNFNRDGFRETREKMRKGRRGRGLGEAHVTPRDPTLGTVGTRSCAEPPSGVRRPCPVQRLGWSMRSGASGVARLDAFPHGCGAVGTRSRAEPPSGVRRPCPVQRLGCSMRSGRPALHVSTRFRTCGAVGTRSRAEPPSGVRRPCPVQRLGWPMRSGASGVARLDAPFVVLYSALSTIAPSVNVLRRTRRKPSTIRGAAPDVVIGQSTANRAGARPYQARAQPQIGRARWLRR